MPTNCDTEVYQLLNKPLSHHVWNSDKTKIAVCPNNEEIIVLKKDGLKWTVEDVLKEHDQLITGLDWCPVTDKIITCSMDRNAYVWVSDTKGKWKPTLATLRISKGATCVSWNANGTKFAAGSSNGSIVVGYFEAENDWWLCKHLKVNTENTITSIAWHPNGNDVIAGSIDGNILITSGYMKSVDKDGKSEPIFSFNEQCQVPVLDVTFSPTGQKIAYLTYDAKLTVVNLESNTKESIPLGELPMLHVKFLSDDLIITTGHNYSPMLISIDKSTGKWHKFDNLMAADSKKKASSSAFGSAFAKFKSMDDCGVNDSDSSHKLGGHRNTISKLNLLKNESGKVQEFSTSSLDGNLIIWDIKNVLNNQKFANLSI